MNGSGQGAGWQAVVLDAVEARARARVLRLPELDWLVGAVLMLAALGLVMAVSTTACKHGVALSDRGIEPAAHVLGAHVHKLGFGTVAFLLAVVVPLPLLRLAVWPMWAAGVAAVWWAALFGEPTNQASRWLELGGFRFQPVDLARLALLLLVAHLCARHLERRGDPQARDGIGAVQGLACALIPALPLALGLLLQPDTGNALLLSALAMAVAVVAGMRLLPLTLVAVPAFLGLALLVWQKPHVRERVEAFVAGDPPLQVQQSLTAIQSGGLLGRGLGNGWMKMGFLPEANNDFVFAVVVEELGLAGGLGVLLLFTIVGWTCLRLFLAMAEPFNKLVVVGLTLAIGLQAALNLCVVTALVPPKGIDLPFVSSGGTNLMACLAAVGLIGNAARSDAGLAERAAAHGDVR